MELSDSILKACLKDVYFINGTAYAGKSTMVRMLADKHGMIHCGENYHTQLSEGVATPEEFPNIGYFQTMENWQAFIGRSPAAYARWIEDTSREAAGFEIAILLRLSGSGRRIIVDTNVPVDVLWRISDYGRVALMLSPQSLSVDSFFNREDADKQFLLRQIALADDPDAAMANFRACLVEINGPQVVERFEKSGFYTLYRADDGQDTRPEMLRALEAHFSLG